MAFLGANHADASTFQNPASPDVLTIPPPWEISRSDTATPTAAMHASPDLIHVPQPTDVHLAVSTHDPISSAESRSTGDLPASNTEATGTGELDGNTTQEYADLESKSSVTAVSLQAGVSATELPGLNDSTEPADDVPEDRPGIPGKIR